jgi:hypothetical protein
VPEPRSIQLVFLPDNNLPVVTFSRLYG